MATQVSNFGGNVRFTPKRILTPTNASELLQILNDNRNGCVRVIGAKHSWSSVCETEDTLINMASFQQVRVEQKDGQTVVHVGAGCRIRTLLHELNRHGLTTPSVGLITAQTVAGAIATGTHGSGKHSLSHYVLEMKIACFPNGNTSAEITTISDGAELRAARCALGCLGVVVEVTLPCIPQYFVREQTLPRNTIEEILELEDENPLQQFFLLPHAWTWFAQTRRVDERSKRSRSAWLYRIYWFLSLDIGLHVLIKLFAVALRSRWLVHFLFRQILPRSLFPRWIVTDRSDRQLTMRHDLFRHLELEVFVRGSQVVAASRLICEFLKTADDAQHSVDPEILAHLETIGMREKLLALAGRFTHHYPICFRRILPDDTLISMASGAGEDWYSISLITYKTPRADFFEVATLIAQSVSLLFAGRIHWGKWFPLNAEFVERQYPNLAAFRKVATSYDAGGVFANEFVRNNLNLVPDPVINPDEQNRET